MNDIYIAIIVASSGLIGAVIGALSTIGITYINRRFDDRRHFREIAIQTAVTHWDKKRELAIMLNERTGQAADITPRCRR